MCYDSEGSYLEDDCKDGAYRVRPRYSRAVRHTVQSRQPSNGPPDPPSPGVGADAKQERKACDNGTPCPQLGEVPRGAPDHAEHLVLLLAVVRDTVGERAALVVGVRQPAAVGEAGDHHHLPVAALREAVLDRDPGMEHLGVVDDEPVERSVSDMPVTVDCVRPNQSGRRADMTFYDEFQRQHNSTIMTQH